MSSNQKKGKGRPKTLGVKQEQLVHNDENHWTNSEIAGLFLETLAHHGVYKLPIETGVKAKKKWENLQLSNKEDVKSKFAAKELEIKNKIDKLEEEAKKLYEIQGERNYYFVRQKGNEDVKFDDQGNLIDQELPPDTHQFTLTDPEKEKEYGVIRKALQSLAFVLEPSFCQSIQDLFNAFVDNSESRVNFDEKQMVALLVQRVKDDPKTHRELLACQYIKDGYKPEKKELDEMLNEKQPQQQTQDDYGQPEVGDSNKAKKLSKAAQKKQILENKLNIQIPPELKEQIEESCETVSELIREMLEAFKKQ